jgi:uncharacterized protein
MTEYLSPGVYIEEKSSGVKPIEGVGTSTGAFIGIAERGPIGEAKFIANWTQFVNTYGSFINNSYLAYSVYQFFAEGGTRCYVVRTCHYENIVDKETKKATAATGIMNDDDDAGSLKFTASEEGTWSHYISIEAKEATDKNLQKGFKLVIRFKGNEQESFDDLTMENVLNKINSVDGNGGSKYVKVEKVGDTPNAPKRDTTMTLGPGNNGDSSISEIDFEGDEKAGNGLHAFDVIDDINIVAMPDMAGNRNAIIKGYNYCQNRKDCFFIADSPSGLSPTQVKDFKEARGDYTGQNPFNSSFGALYYPWVLMNDSLNDGKSKPVPPSGAVAGTYAHTDSVRGVHKVPAGTSEGYLDSVSGIERIITKSEHGILNEPGINVIRSFPTAGICIWGARTLSADPEWKYINIRRLFLFLEESLDKSTQWVVFEPNSPALWGSVKRNITEFLLRVWRDGALFGATPEEAFFVKVDEENNPEEVRNAGQLIIEVGVAPVRPAEFIIIRIKQNIQAK